MWFLQSLRGFHAKPRSFINANECARDKKVFHLHYLNTLKSHITVILMSTLNIIFIVSIIFTHFYKVTQLLKLYNKCFLVFHHL